MKHVLCTIILLAVVVSGMFVTTPVNAEVSQTEKKFELTYTITYNAITLAEASKIEARVKGNHEDACKVDTTVKEVQNITNRIRFTNSTNRITVPSFGTFEAR